MPPTSIGAPLRRWKRSVLMALAAMITVAAHAASYRVYPLPIASPDHGVRALLVNPHSVSASPFGWHDTNGAPGPEFTILRGNNVWVYLDQDNDNQPDGFGPDGGAGLVFDYPAAPGLVAPLIYADALATNAFYLGNMMHDILWHHGFREADGNFQVNNYGQGGLGNDPVRIEIFNGGGFNNANSTLTADGDSPRIQLYVWNMTDPAREPSFDAAVLGWAYMQPTQARLVGTSCLANSENPRFGYGDYFGTLLTTDFATTTPATPRPMATWIIGQPVTGPGIRGVPYSVDMSIDPRTYADSPTSNVPAGVGSIFASVLWDLTWRLVELEGFSGNLFGGDGGENRALRLVIQALKSQPCNAGLVSARDALLAANQALYGGADQCELWQVFARRGLGASASQGLSSTNTDNVAAFDVPAMCQEGLFQDGFEPAPPGPAWSLYCSAPGVIAIPSEGPSSPYPVPIVVSGPSTELRGIRFHVLGLSHTFPDDIDILLVGPDGRRLVVQSDAGGGADVANISYVIDDAAALPLPDSTELTSASFRPTNHGVGDSFPVPAPQGSLANPEPAGFATLTGAFVGHQANGVWNVYVVDDAALDSGSVQALCLEVGR
jgi:hypothetical protein